MVLVRIWVQDGEDREPQECYNYKDTPYLEWTGVQKLVEKSDQPIFLYSFDFYTREEIKEEHYDYEFFQDDTATKIAMAKISADARIENAESYVDADEDSSTNKPAPASTAAATNPEPSNDKQAFQAKIEDGDEAK